MTSLGTLPDPLDLVAALPDPSLLSDAELEIWMRICTSYEERRRYVWERYARPDQLPPKSKAVRVWFLMGGRGSGKTRTGAETMKTWARKRPNQHFAVVAKTHREVLNICFEAPRAGLIRVVPPWEVIQFLRGSGSVAMTMANGTVLRAFSAQDPEAMRGYAFDKVWLDEYAAYPVKMAQVVYDMAWFCMREAPEPQMVITSTPKPLPHVKKLLELADARPDRYVVTRSRTIDNRKNLSGPALELLLESYDGTRIGRQELDAELLEDVEGALWKLSWIEAGRVLPEYVYGDEVTGVPPQVQFVRKNVAVDPADTVSETSDETGIIVAGLSTEGEVFVLDDRSGKCAGLDAAFRVWQAWIDHGCEYVVIEGSSLWMMDTLSIAWRALQEEGLVPPGDPPVKTAQPFASKQMRAAPIAAVYEKVATRGETQVHHVGTFPKLEEQQVTWTPEPDGPGGTKSKSPDRLDALVYAVGDLLGTIPLQATIASVATIDAAVSTRARGWGVGNRGRPDGGSRRR